MQVFLHDFTPSNSSFSNLPYNEYVLQITLYHLKYWYTPTVVIVGVVFNLISFITLNRRRFSRFTCTPFIAAMCITDCVFLIVLGLIWLKRIDVNIDLYNTGGWCQALTYLSSSSAFLSVWLTASVNVDRCINISCPSCFSISGHFCTPLRAKLLVCGLCITAIVVYLNISILMGVVQTLVGPLCLPLFDFAYRVQILGRVDLFVNFIVPYVITVISCILCTRKICWMYGQERIMKRQQRTSSGRASTRCSNQPTFNTRHLYQSTTTNSHSPTSGETDRTELYMTRAVLLSCLIYLLLTLPYQLLRSWVNLSVMFSQTPYVVMSKTFKLWQLLLMNAYFTRFGVNGFVYFLSIPSFRKELASLLFKNHCKRAASVDEDVGTNSLIANTPEQGEIKTPETQTCTLMCVTERYNTDQTDPLVGPKQTTSKTT